MRIVESERISYFAFSDCIDILQELSWHWVPESLCCSEVDTRLVNIFDSQLVDLVDRVSVD